MEHPDKKVHLAVLASGSGSNAVRFMSYFRDHPHIKVALVVSNNASAPVLHRARKAGVPTKVMPGPAWDDSVAVGTLFDHYRIDAIVLAGYMRLLPYFMIQKYPHRIFNIHPALLPDFGGKGMYGLHVHRAVINSGARKSGITIHLVNEKYDDGPILFQDTVDVLPGDTPEELAARVQHLEHYHYPRVVERYVLQDQLSRKPGNPNTA